MFSPTPPITFFPSIPPHTPTIHFYCNSNLHFHPFPSQWQSRVYTFLFRRILGPYLTPKSQKSLHKSLNVSLRAGNFELLDVEFDGTAVASKLNLAEQDVDVSLERIHVKRMAVSLSLLYFDKDGQVVESYDEGSARLIANVSLDGVDVQIRPGSGQAASGASFHKRKEDGSANANPIAVGKDESTIGKMSAIRSYVQAAIDTLKLSLDVNDITIRIASNEDAWVSLNIASINYRDESEQDGKEEPPANDKIIDKNRKTNVNVSKKELDIDTITLTVGESSEEEEYSEEVIRSEGISVVRIMDESSGKVDIGRSLEVIMDPEFVVNTSVETMQRMIQVATDISRSSTDTDDDPQVRFDANAMDIENSEMVDECENENGSHQSSDEDLEDPDFDNGLLANIIQTQVNENYMDNLNKKGQNGELGGKEGADQQPQTTGNTTTSVPQNRSRNVSNDSEADIDGFFDSEDENISHYRSALEASLMMEAAGKEKRAASVTSTSLNVKVKKVSMNLHLYDEVAVARSSDRKPDDTVVLTMECLHLSSTKRDLEKSITMELSVFRMDHISQYTGDDGLSFISPLVEIVGENNAGETSGPVCSASFDKFEDDHNQSVEIEVMISVNPIHLICRQSIISKISSHLGVLTGRNQSKESSNETLITDSSRPNMNCTFLCDSLVVFVPIESDRETDEENLCKIFDRCGYVTNCPQEVNESTLSLEARQFSFKFAKMYTESECGDEDSKIAISFERSVVSFMSPALNTTTDDRCEENFHNPVRRLDLLTFEGEEKIDPDALIRAEIINSCLMHKNEIEKKKRARAYFPLVTPLASVKASQQYDSNDVEAKGSLPEKQARKSGKKRLRGSDPQVAMLKNIHHCEKIFKFHIPSAAIDLAIPEIDGILNVFSNRYVPRKSSNHNVEPSRETEDEDSKEAENSFCFNFLCDQFTLSIHQKLDTSESHKTQHINHMFVCDGFQSHIFVEKNALKHIRVLAEDMTLYESEESVSTIDAEAKRPKTLQDICDQIRMRRSDNNTNTAAKLFRSKISHPLSPTTPSGLIDVIISKDEYHSERTVHVSIYDMTHRYQFNSTWIETIGNIFNRQKQKEHNANEDESGSSQEAMNNLFITLSDCNVDYTAPENFNAECRTIMRIGELRITTKILSPAGPSRVIKMTLADASIHVANQRVGHEMENTKLSCSKPVMKFVNHKMSSTDPHLIPHSFDDALSRMDFVRIMTLDCLDSTVSLSTPTPDSLNDADCFIKLSAGQACLYACKDSFLCFTESTNELVNNLTMPTNSELEEMRKDFISKQNQSNEHDVSNRVKEETATVASHDSESMKTAASLVEVIDHDLFGTVDIEQEEEEDYPSDKRDVIDDFFTVGRKNIKSSRSYCATTQVQQTANIDSWTTVHHVWDNDQSIAEGEEQSARWYTEEELQNTSHKSPSSLLLPSHTKVIIDGGHGEQRTHLFPKHIPIDPVMNPLDPSLNDMGASKYAGTAKPPKVNMRVMVEDMSFHFRFFDGHDWDDKASRGVDDSINTAANILNSLVDGEGRSMPLFENSKKKNVIQSGRSQRYFQFSFTGLKLRLDSYEDSQDHSLSSCMDLTFADLYFIETISGSTPVKLLGEWISDEHLRDSNDGLMMMKLVSMLPDKIFSSDGKLMGNEGRVTLEFLPIRFFINQVALRFIRGFFRSEKEPVALTESSIATPPEMFFPIFKVKPFNIKVDYKPKHIDTAALKDGSLVELLNVLPLEEMVLRLSEVEMRNLTGWGSIISELACNWLQDVSSTQMHKFLTRTSPLHPFTTVGDGMKQFLMIPLEEYQQKGDVKKGFRKGTKKLASVLAYETLSVGAKVSGFVAKKLKKKNSKSRVETDHQLSHHGSTLPRSMNEVSNHAIESFTRGLKEANAKMIIIPYRQYQESGTKGAMKSVVKGLPVAVCAPLSGAAEAVSYSLYGVRHQLRPDLREEEDASNRLHEFHF